jgi:hypothetical protein
LEASAKNAKIWSRGSSNDIPVVSVCNIGILYDEVDGVTQRFLS